MFTFILSEGINILYTIQDSIISYLKEDHVLIFIIVPNLKRRYHLKLMQSPLYEMKTVQNICKKRKN